VLVLGDFNTMGTEDAPPLSAQEALAAFDGELAPGFRRLAMTPNCTEYFERQAGALDHTIASAGMQEAAATARATGYCALGRSARGVLCLLL
jgi:predicted extracellular nuclease